MKKLNVLLIIAMALVMLPFNVQAKDDNEHKDKTSSQEEDKKENKDTEKKEEKKQVNVYFFMGDGCGYCEAGLNWFNSIKKEYGDKYDLYTYETWYDEDNSQLMSDVAAFRKEEVSGVPYIIVGNKMWNGFGQETGEEILEEIEKQYKIEPSKRYDTFDLMGITPTGKVERSEKKDYKKDVIATIILLAVVGGAGFGIYKLREDN